MHAKQSEKGKEMTTHTQANSTYTRILVNEARQHTLRAIAKSVSREMLVSIIDSLLSSDDNQDLTDSESNAGCAAFDDLCEIGQEMYPGFDPGVEIMQILG